MSLMGLSLDLTQLSKELVNLKGENKLPILKYREKKRESRIVWVIIKHFKKYVIEM